MKIFENKITGNGRHHVYFCGIKIASYKTHSAKDKMFLHGINNKIINPQKECICDIYGNNNKIVFGKNTVWCGCIHIGLPDTSVDNCSVIIGDNSTSNDVSIMILEDNTNIEIGDDCMFSSKIKIMASDTHTITDNKGNITNIGEYIKFGNHVWVGSGVAVAKNTIVADGCVIGMNSVVTGKHKTPNCIIAGNPAKDVKQNINWDRRRPKKYITDIKNENS